MEAGPSDYICLNCNLRFKNSRSFENHKRKFCQPQERISKAIITASRGYQESLNGQTEFPLKSATNGADFWSGKPTTSQSAFKSSGSYEGFILGTNGYSQNYGNFNKISADVKLNSVLDDLQNEHEKLEEHKRAIQQKLASMQHNGSSQGMQKIGRSPSPVSGLQRQKEADGNRNANRERNRAMVWSLICFT